MNHREMTHDEMEAKAGRPVLPAERVIFLREPCAGAISEWHLILGIWNRMQLMTPSGDGSWMREL